MIWLLLLNSIIGADAYQDTFAQANAAYESGRYQEAVVAYEQLVASGAAASEVFYNLGNAYARNGQRGAAIANYERALRANPGFTQARENRDVVLKQTERNLAAPLAPGWHQALLFWDEGLAYSTVRWLALLFWLGGWGLLAVRLWRPLPYLRIVAAVLLVAGVLSGLSAWNKAHPPRLAVATDTNVSVRFGPDNGATVRFELHEGDRVAVDRARDGWLRVTTVDGQRGWAQDANLIRVGPPYELPSLDAAREMKEEAADAN